LIGCLSFFREIKGTNQFLFYINLKNSKNMNNKEIEKSLIQKILTESGALGKGSSLDLDKLFKHPSYIFNLAQSLANKFCLEEVDAVVVIEKERSKIFASAVAFHLSNIYARQIPVIIAERSNIKSNKEFYFKKTHEIALIKNKNILAVADVVPSISVKTMLVSAIDCGANVNFGTILVSGNIDYLSMSMPEIKKTEFLYSLVV